MHVSPSVEMGPQSAGDLLIDDAAYDRCDSLEGLRLWGRRMRVFPHRSEIGDVADDALVVAYRADIAAARKGDLAG